MGLVPVRECIVRGYTFLFARFFTVLGLGWLSAAFYGFACAWLIRAVSTGALGAPPASGAFNQYSLAYLVALLIVTAFFAAPMLIPFTREALGMHEEPVAAHFSYGPREWRLFVALLRVFGLIGGTLFVLIVASGIAINQVAPMNIVWLGIPLTSWLNVLSAIVVLSAGAFLSVRLGFFLGPIAAVEGHAKLARAWVLSRANFWRLSLVFLAVAVPAALVVLIFEYALWGSELGAATQSTGSNALAMFKLQYDHAISISAMLATALTAVNALFASASAFAYRALDAETEEASAETEASAPESNWGIHRATALATLGFRGRAAEPEPAEQYEPSAFPNEAPAIEQAVAEAPTTEVVEAPAPEFAEAPSEVAEAPIEHVAEEVAVVEPTVEQPAEASHAEVATEVTPALADEPTPHETVEVVEVPAAAPMETTEAVPTEAAEAEFASAEETEIGPDGVARPKKPKPPVAVVEAPAEMPLDGTVVAEAEPPAVPEAQIQAAAPIGAPLDPIGLAQAPKTRELA